MAWRARLLCPTASIRTERKEQVPENIFPEELTDGVYASATMRPMPLVRTHSSRRRRLEIS